MIFNLIALISIIAGVCFFIVGSIGLIRLPDQYSRLHALTKADNLGLGLIIAGLAMHSQDVLVALKLFIIWFAVMAASSASAYLMARKVRRDEVSS